MKSPNILFWIFAAVTMTFGFSTSAASGQGNCSGEINGDGFIDGVDLAVVLGPWGSGPEVITSVTSAGSVGAASIEVTDAMGTATASGAFTSIAIIVPSWATLLESAPDPAVVTDVNLRAAIVASGFAWRIRDNSSNIDMLLVPAGTFMMGCSPGDGECGSNEHSAHQVTLTNAFYIGKTEVTQAQWTANMGSNPSGFSGYSDSPSRPVEQVSWNMIASTGGFMSITGLRLPTEAEWEYACRAGTTTAHYGELSAIAWWYPTDGTQPVASKLPNALGLYDTLGNVYEWCQDWYGPYSAGSVTNPTGPNTGAKRLMRSGSFYSYSIACRASRRDSQDQSYSYNHTGFRVARNP